MEELTNDKQLAKLTKKYGSEKVEAEYEKFNSILQNKKINYVISFIWVLLAYILSLLSTKYKWIVFGTEMYSFLSLLIITAFIIDKLLIEDLLKMPLFPIIVALAIINIIVQLLILDNFAQGLLILTMIFIKKSQKRA